MSKFKRLTIGLSIVATMVVAFVCGIIGLNVSKRQHTIGNVDNVEQEVEKIKPSEITYKASDISIQTGVDNLDYSYVPGVNSGEDASTVIAYEYIFGNAGSELMAVNLKTIEEYDDVTISFAYSDKRLDLEEDVTTYTKFTTQTVPVGDDNKYIYIFLAPSEGDAPVTFSTSLYWNYGKAGEFTIVNTFDGSVTKQTIVKGQTIDLDTLNIPECDYNFMGWYEDSNFTKEITSTIVASSRTIYAQYPNLPTDYLGYYYSYISSDYITEYYYIKSGTSELPKNLILPATYKNGLSVKLNSNAKGLCSNNDIESVFIPKTMPLRSAAGVFKDCTTLKRVVFEDNWLVDSTADKYMTSGIFANCTSLESIDFGENSALTSFQSETFLNCISLKTIHIPDSVTTIWYNVFNGSGVTTVTFGENSKLTTIYENAFSGCPYLSNITLPASVTTIETDAFKDCVSLTKINIPAGVTTLGSTSSSANVDSPFNGCLSLSEVTFDESSQLTTIGNSAFEGCNALQSITIPDSVTSIVTYAFAGCSALQSIIIPSGVTSIGNNAFLNCSALTSVDFGENSQLTSIGGSAFYNCSSLQSLTIPTCVTSIGNNAFLNCSALTSVDFGENSQLTSIGSSAFSSCSALQRIIIPEGVTTIQSSTFSECGALTSITIPASVTTIAGSSSFPSVFKGCMSLMEVIFREDSKLTTISDCLFYECGSLQSILIPASVTSIGWKTFYGCTALTSVEFAENGRLTTIGVNAFYYCKALQRITIPVSVTKIDSNAFSGCYDLAEVYNLSKLSISAGSTSNGNVAEFASVVQNNIRDDSQFATIDGVDYYKNSETDYMAIRLSDKSVTEIVFDSRTTSIGRYAFYDCDSIGKVTMPESVTSIGNYAFYGCGALQSITIPDSVTSIGNCAFYGCGALQSITIPAGITSIGTDAFRGCYDLAEVYNLSKLNITAGSNGNGYVACYASIVQKDERDTSKLVTIDGVDYYKNSETDYMAIRLSDKSVSDIVLDDRTTSIGIYTFYDCDLLVSINMPSSVTNIGNSAFSRCSGLTSVDFEENSQLKTIGQSSFEYCSALKSITIQSGVTSIGSNAFQDCYDLAEVYNLSSLSISAGNTNYGYVATYASIVQNNIRDDSQFITIDGVEYYINEDDFIAIRSRDDLTSVTLDNRTTAIGKYAFYNCKTLTGITMPSSVTSIGNYAFYNTGLTSVAIPDRVTSIGDRAFYNCKLTSITFGENSQLTSIGSFAFYECGVLQSITIPDSVVSIGSSAFYRCRSLKSINIPSGVTSMTSQTFSDCSALAEVYITDMHDWCNIDFGGDTANPLHKGAKLYLNGEWVTSLTIPSSITEIKPYAFYGYTSITSINIPTSVTSIGNYAFYGCSALTEVNFATGSQLTSIGNRAFYGCSVLTGIVLPSTLTNLGYDVFTGCTALVYNELNDGYYLGSSTNPYLALVQTSSSSITSIAVHADTQVIGGRAFYNHTKLTSVDLSACTNLKGISYGAFYGCKVLPSITIPNTVTFLGQYLFQGCSVLATIEFEDNSQLTSIGSYAFYGCSALTSITIPSSVISIGSSAFYSCGKLTSITIPYGVMSIGAWAFYSCSALTSITIPSSVTSIGSYAFYNCTGLTSITFSENSKLESIGGDAFYNCTGLTSITIPSSVTSIGSYAFNGCSKLTSITFEVNEGEDLTQLWYRTKSATDCANKENGTVTNLSTPTRNDDYFKSSSYYYNYYWYKK